MLKTVLHLVACAAALTVAQIAYADPSMLATLKGKYPATNFKSVTATPIDGVFEVVMGTNVAYVDRSGRYFMMNARLFDMQTQTDMTEAKIEEANRIDLASLPLKDAVKDVRGSGKRTLVLFSDPNCGYCKDIEQKAIRHLKDVTIYTFLYPILSPDSRTKTDAVWCAKDQTKAWAGLMLEGKVPTSLPCDTPTERVLALGQKLRINGTPTLISADGRKMPGAGDLASVNAFIDGSSERVAKVSRP
jgi:thiol:disulfide interchange protein DsbC